MGELKQFLRDFVPKDVYCSCAYYENPEAEMEMKGWLGADLVFDIDADHIPTSCDKIHDDWSCGKCGFAGKGILPEKCPICGGEKFEVNTWPCDECLASAKAETIKLLEILTRDFGFANHEMQTFFSGHRGYHVHVENEAVRTLDAMGRKEIVDYVSAFGLNVENYVGAEQFRRKTAPAQKVTQGLGWHSRLIMGMKDFAANADEKAFSELGLEKRFTALLARNKDVILKNFQKTGTFGYVRGIGSKTWIKIAKHVAKLKSANVDTVVTTDVHRLIRLTDTLNGKTGFRKVEFSISSIDKFDPFKAALAFKEGSVNVKVYNAPKFRLGDEIFGPYKNQRVELPTAAAVLLICRNRAEVLD